MATIAINQQTTSLFSSREVSHLQNIASLQATGQAKTANAATDKSRSGFLAVLLRALAACAV